MAKCTPTEAVRLMLVEHDLVHEFAIAIKQRRGWRGSDKDAHTRVLHMFNDYGSGPRGLWLDDAELACELAGVDPLSPFFAEAAARGEAVALRRRLAQIEKSRRPRMTRVRRGLLGERIVA